jgi:hypothetical protein
MTIDWRKYYDKEHIIYPLSKEINERESHLWNLVKKLIHPDSVQSMLDIGCGAGHITNNFSNMVYIKLKE